jgi:hypothetical protein
MKWLDIFRGRESTPPGRTAYYDVYKVRVNRFYGLCGSEHYHIAYCDDYTPYVRGDNKGELVANYVSELDMIEFKPRMVLSRDCIRHDLSYDGQVERNLKEEYKPLDFIIKDSNVKYKTEN